MQRLEVGFFSLLFRHGKAGRKKRSKVLDMSKKLLGAETSSIEHDKIKTETRS